MSKLGRLGALWLLGPPLVYVGAHTVHRLLGVVGVVLFTALCVVAYTAVRKGNV